MREVRINLTFSVSWGEEDRESVMRWSNDALLKRALQIYGEASYKEIGESVIVKSVEVVA